MGHDPVYTCPECQLGVLRQRRVSYFTVHAGQLISVPDFPAWVCDVCGRREYDAAALAELRAMLNTARPPRRRIHRRRTGGDAARPRDPADARRRT